MNENNEVRLIDANKIKPVHVEYYGKVVDWATIEYAPTIDPEKLPVVRQLQEELARMTAERDAAVADLKTMCDCDYCENDCVNTEEETCEFCGVKNCSCRGCIDGRNWTWRGPQKEE